MNDALSQNSIIESAARFGLALSESAAEFVESHARNVLEQNALLHLTTVTEPAEFLERHIEESWLGASLLSECAGFNSDAPAVMLDLGSGNGYPGLPIAALHPNWTPYLGEASGKKAAFLAEQLDRLGRGQVAHRQIQRAADWEHPQIDVLVTRAMGSWEKVLPRMWPAMSSGSRLVVWSGDEFLRVANRSVWRKFGVLTHKVVANKQRSAVWLLERLDETPE